MSCRSLSFGGWSCVLILALVSSAIGDDQPRRLRRGAGKPAPESRAQSDSASPTTGNSATPSAANSSSPDGKTAYDPLRLLEGTLPAPIDFEARDERRNRPIPLRVYLPATKEAAPVILFSHGLGGSREGNAYLGKHWSARGYVVVAVQHPGSDTDVWKDKPLVERMASMKKAASINNFLLRVSDIPSVLDQLETWNRTDKHPLAGRMDLHHVGMSGHSFGAITTQAVSGQHFPMGDSLKDKRIQAAIAFSPSGPRAGGDPQVAFGDVRIPWLLMTGTNDTSPIGDIDVKSRLSVFPALPVGEKYEVVFEGAEHSAFSDRALPGDRQKRNPNHHRAILALSTAFWDSYLRSDPQAREWLDGSGPRSVLEEEDRWQRK